MRFKKNALVFLCISEQARGQLALFSCRRAWDGWSKVKEIAGLYLPLFLLKNEKKEQRKELEFLMEAKDGFGVQEREPGRATQQVAEKYRGCQFYGWDWVRQPVSNPPPL